MKLILIFLKILMLFIMIFSDCHRKDNFPILKGDYLGQKPPGDIPEIFAPGIITHGFHELSISFSPAGDELFYSMSDRGYAHYALIHLQMQDNTWLSPRLAPFSKKMSVYTSCFSPDGNTLFFSTNRPIIQGTDTLTDVSIWSVEKRNGSWGEAKPMSYPLNSGSKAFIQSVSQKKTIYLSKRIPERQHDIFAAHFVDGRYLQPISIKGAVNSEFGEVRPFIAPDESYLIFQSDRDGSYGGNDLWISFKNQEDDWGQPINLGEPINSAASDFGPSVTPDGKYLFFSSYRTHNPEFYRNKGYKTLLDLYRSPLNGYATLYWVDARFIEKLKQENEK